MRFLTPVRVHVRAGELCSVFYMTQGGLQKNFKLHCLLHDLEKTRSGGQFHS